MPFLIPAAIAVGSAISTAAFVASDILVPLALGAVGASSASLAAVSGFAFAATTTVIETAALAGISAVLSPHPAINTAGSPQQFKPDPNAGIPVIMGRYGVGGNLVYETTSGGGNSTAAGAKGNEYLTSFVILSGLGPLNAFETLRFNDTILTFDSTGQSCNGGYIPEDEVQFWNPGYTHQNPDGSYVNNNYQDHAWQNLQLGALNAGYFPPPTKLASDNAGLPEWTTAHGFSSFAAAAVTLVYDQRYYAGGVPQYQWVLQGIKTYDPRQDSTYPGGSGPQRWAGEGATAAEILAARATWTFSQNPAIHALNYALGHFLPNGQTGPGRLYAGIGAGIAGVDVPAFVAAANVSDANGWLVCGQWTTSDGKWSVITEMLKAGSATPVIDCGIISCIVDTPLTSLGTVTADDLSGPITLPTGASFTARINTVFPRYTSEAHRWQMVQADTPVMAATYVTEDGAVRSKTLDWQYVPAVNQACQLAAYTITNGREIPGIKLPGKPKLRNYKVGDCFTVDIPEAGLATTKVMVTERVTEQQTGGVTLTVRTETDAKHPYSLGVSGVAPATPGISGYDPAILDVPLPASWASGAIEFTDASTGESRSVIQVTGATDSVYAQDLLVRYRLVAEVNDVWTPLGSGAWSFQSFPATQTQFDLDLNPGAYDVQIAYVAVGGAYPAADQDWLDLGVETISGSVASNTANVSTMSAADVVAGIAAAQQDAAAANAAVDAASAQITAATDAANAAAQAVNEAADAADDQAGQLEDAAEAALAAAVQQGAQLLELHAANFTAAGLPIGPFSQETAQETATANSTLAVMGQMTPNGAGFVLNNQAVYYANGQTLSQLVNQLSSATSAVSATLTSSYLTATQTTSAIAVAQTQLQSSINGVSATLTSTYMTSAQTTSAISVAETSLQSSINGVSATLTSSYMTSASTTQAVAQAQTTLQANINGVSSTLTSTYMTAAQTTSAISSLDTSLTASINNVTADLNTNFMTSASTTQAIAQAQTQLQASIGSVSANLTNNYLTAASTTLAISQAQTTLQSNINGVSANLTNYYMTSASTTQAIASLNTTLTASLNGLSASVSSQGTAIASLGSVSGTYTLAVSAGGVVTGIKLLSTSGQTGSISAIQFSASEFLIQGSNGNAATPFEYNADSETLYLANIVVSNAVMGEASIGTLNLGSGSVTQAFSTFNSNGYTLSGTGGAASAATVPPSAGSSTTAGGSSRGVVQQ